MSKPDVIPLRDSTGELNPELLVELAVPAERALILEGCTPDELADLAEKMRLLRKRAEEAAAAVTDTIREVEDTLARKLGPGEVVMASSTGRFAYLGLVSAGKAEVRREAIDEHVPDLPEDLRPRPEVRYPSVTDLRRAKRRLGQLGLRVSTFLKEPPKVPGIRWRTLEDDRPEAS